MSDDEYVITTNAEYDLVMAAAIEGVPLTTMWMEAMEGPTHNE